MKQILLGKTGIKSHKNAFGALPVQRVSEDTAVLLLRKAYANGITFFDTARAYSDSEKKLGLALADVRENITIATKTGSTTVEGFWSDLGKSLEYLKTNYIDIYQFHNPAFCPKLGDGSGLYEAMLEAKAQGKIHHIGITNHRLHIAEEAVLSGLYGTLQFPFCYLAADKDFALVELCRKEEIGFIAMKALSGGLISNSRAAYAWMDQYDHVLPIWGIQRETELDEFLGYMTNPPKLTEELRTVIEKDRRELLGNFCRACGYCMPCPMGIEINTCARMTQLIRRSPSANWLTERSREMMMKIETCMECGQCKSKCPYGLNTPELLKMNLQDYKEILTGRVEL